MRKTLICMLALLMLVLAVLTACGGGDSSSETKPDGENSKPDTSKPNENTFSSDVSKNPSKKSDPDYSSEPACEHEAVIDAAVEATCATPGKTEGSHCAKCGEVLVAQEVIPAGHIFVDGKCTMCGLETSKGLEYKLNKDGKSYAVTGIGSCTDTDLVIPPTYEGKPVTSIGEGAFYRWYSGLAITSVTIPDSVTSIGDDAFSYCTELMNITIPDSVISIGGDAFSSTAYYNDESNWENDVLYIGKCLIKAKQSFSGSYSIREGTTCIAGEAFYYCSRLTSITIPDSVISIGEYAFSGCSGLTSVTIPDSVISIGNSAFSGCKELTSVTIPNSVTSIGDSAFFECSGLTSVTIPDSVISLGDQAFYHCYGLTSVTIGNGVTRIRDEAFEDCSELIDVTIGRSVISIGGEAFYHCRELTNITYNGTKEQWEEISKDGGWKSSTGLFTVYCTDGKIAKDNA